MLFDLRLVAVVTMSSLGPCAGALEGTTRFAAFQTLKSNISLADCGLFIVKRYLCRKDRNFSHSASKGFTFRANCDV